MAGDAEYGNKVILAQRYDAALERVTTELKAQGFGVLTTIDVQATLKEKLGVEHDRYTILGACNPPLAYQALKTEPDIGLLLPCNVIVYENPDGESTTVSVVNPLAMMSFTGNSDLAAVATEANTRLEKVVAALGS